MPTKTKPEALEKCPYYRICPEKKCGDEGLSGGFTRRELLVTCVNWQVTLSLDEILELANLPEGRHYAGVDSADKIDSAHDKYLRSPKGKKALERYRLSDKGIRARARHAGTVKDKLTKAKYYYSDKGQQAAKSRLDRQKEVRLMDKWMQENPGKTISDYFKEKTKQ